VISTLISSILPVASTVIDRLVPDKNAQAKIKAEMEKALVSAEAAGMLAQSQANVESAKHPSVFVAGARPAIMWICAAALGWQFIGNPLAVWAVTLWAPGTPIPSISSEGLFPLTMSLLGLGTMRSAEKWRGVARENMKKTP
tara:strand:+ start:803 stop:1228 length:426 start_codon:yes stop_codon:yes gene_type:complete